MDFQTLARSRYSSRSYLPKTVEKEKLLQILETARIAPSAANKQPLIFYVANTSESLSKFYDLYHREWFKKAMAIIVVCADHNQGWVRADGKDHCDIDAAIAVDHMTLQATELGLATCWICNFDVAKCREVLNLPSHIEPIVILPVAYPADFTNIERHIENRKQLNKSVIFV